MKKLQYCIFLLSAVFISCSEKEEFPVDKVMVEVSTLEFEAEGGVQSFEVKTHKNYIMWDVESTVDWCKFKFSDPNGYYSPNKIFYGVGSRSVTIEVLPNEEGKERETDLVVRWNADGQGLEPIYVKTKQKFKYSTELSVSPQEIDITTNGTRPILSIEADAYWEAVDIPDWLSLNQEQGFGNGKITVRGKGDESNSGKFTITTQGKSIDIHVRKWGKIEAYIETNGADNLDGILFQEGLYNITKKLKINGWMSTYDFSVLKKMLVLEELDLTDIQFRSGVNELPPYALTDGKFRSILLPKNLLALNTGVFSSCPLLQSIDIPEGTLLLGSFAFSWCTSLEYVTLPNSLKSIDTAAFSHCTSLKEIHIKNPKPFTIPNIVDFQIKNSCTVYVPKGSKEKYQNTAGWSDFKNIVEE
ncbi:leucine-rich repeat protein [Dysgonomonas sp. 521]|uniref:leucine-rich repeat protein n=1 Tax=Dysgonomonas sp. 521 TaxID=2302932 RepID=UPI0013D80E41|nr:leucine-rich repeat protein [Dysgonomonas sp. 521]